MFATTSDTACVRYVEAYTDRPYPHTRTAGLAWVRVSAEIVVPTILNLLPHKVNASLVLRKNVTTSARGATMASICFSSRNLAHSSMSLQFLFTKLKTEYKLRDLVFSKVPTLNP